MDTSTTLQELIELITNCNIMIGMNQGELDEIKEKHNQTIASIEQIDILISNDVQDLNDRLNNIDINCSSADHIVNKIDEVAKVKESLKSLINRVASIEQVFVLRSKRNKRMRESKKRKLDTTGEDELSSSTSPPTISGASSVATTESQDNSPPLTDQSSTTTTTTKVSDESSSAPTPSPTPTGDNKRKRDTSVSGEASSSSSSGVSSSGQATSRGIFDLNSSNLLANAKRRRIERESATKIQAANESSEVSSGRATSSTLRLVDTRRYASYQDRFGLPPVSTHNYTLRLVGTRHYASYQDRFGLPPGGATSSSSLTNQNSTTTTTTTQLSGTTSAFRITSTPITPLTDEEIELTRRRRIERERVCPLAQAEARMFSTQFTSTSAAAPSAPSVDNATDRQTKIDEAIAKALSQEGAEKEKEQVEEDEQLCLALVESELEKEQVEEEDEQLCRAMLESELDQLDCQIADDESASPQRLVPLDSLVSTTSVRDWADGETGQEIFTQDDDAVAWSFDDDTSDSDGDTEDDFICKPCNDDISIPPNDNSEEDNDEEDDTIPATQPQVNVDTTAPPAVAVATEDNNLDDPNSSQEDSDLRLAIALQQQENVVGMRRPRRQCTIPSPSEEAKSSKVSNKKKSSKKKPSSRAATQPEERDTTAPPAFIAAAEDVNVGTRRPRRQCKAKTMEKMSKYVQSDMQSEREALGHMLEDDDNELLDNSDASDNDSSEDDSSIIDEDALSDSSSDESDTDDPPPPPAATTRRPRKQSSTTKVSSSVRRNPKRKKPEPDQPEPSKKQKPPPTTSTRRPRKSGKPDCSIHGCTNAIHSRGLCRLHAYGPKPECSKLGCTNVAAHGRRGLCHRHACGTKKCSKSGCTNVAYRRGLCPQHAYGPKPECSRSGCTNAATRRGLCYRHAYGIKKCSVPGCTTNAMQGLKKCHQHHFQKTCHRCLIRAAKYANGLCPPCRNGVQKCSVPGCTANAKQGMKKCHHHYYGEKDSQLRQNINRRKRERYRTDPEFRAALLEQGRHRKPRRKPRCSVLNCNKYVKVSSNNGSGFCQRHARTEAPEEYAQYRERRNRWQNEQYRTNVEYRLRRLVRGRLRDALRAQGTSCKGKLKLLGCTVDQFKRYLEQFFSESGNRWMDWDNHGRQEGIRCWEMDHIYPLSEFDLTDPEELKRAQHWSNIQPLSAADNGPGGKGADVPDGFEWNGDRWVWSEASGRTNYELPASGAEEDVTSDDDESDEFDESDNE